MDQVAAWCDKNGVLCDKMEELTIDALSDNFGISSVSLILYTDHFELSNQDGEAYAIEVPLSMLKEYMVSQ